jgi:hypothetical protein
VLVRGPQPAYVELIAAGTEETNPWLDRVRSARGPISWAIAVDDVDVARAALVEAGFDPSPVVDGSRRTPEGGVVAWRLCDVGAGPYDGALPFLIEWTAPMASGPSDGPVVEGVSLAPPDPDRVADLLLALGFEPDRVWPRRVFEDPAGVRVTLDPVGPPAGGASWTMGWDTPDAPAASLVLRTASGETTHRELDGVGLLAWPDRRRFVAATLQPVDGDRSPTERADAWVSAVVEAGLGTARDVEVDWADSIAIDVVGATRIDGPIGTQPITVVRGVHPLDRQPVVVVGVGDPVELLERQPAAGHPESRTRQVALVDDAFVHALSGGVFAVRGLRRSVVRHANGWGASGRFADGEPEQWLAQAEGGRRTDGVVRGDAWL